MNRFCVLALMALAGATASASAQQTIAYWRFPAVVPANGDNFKITFPLSADQQFNAGTCAITTDANVWNGQAVPANATLQGAFQYFGGNTLNAQGGDAAGSGLGIRNLSGNLTEGKSITFQIDTTGFYDIILAYAERTSGTGPTSIGVSTSTDGVNFTPFTSVATVRDTNFALRTIDLSSVDGLENRSAAYIRLTTNGFTGASGAFRIDNVTFVPAPSAAVLAAGGILAMGRRRRA